MRANGLILARLPWVLETQIRWVIEHGAPGLCRGRAQQLTYNGTSNLFRIASQGGAVSSFRVSWCGHE